MTHWTTDLEIGRVLSTTTPATQDPAGPRGDIRSHATAPTWLDHPMQISSENAGPTLPAMVPSDTRPTVVIRRVTGWSATDHRHRRAIALRRLADKQRARPTCAEQLGAARSHADRTSRRGGCVRPLRVLLLVAMRRFAMRRLSGLGRGVAGPGVMRRVAALLAGFRAAMMGRAAGMALVMRRRTDRHRPQRDQACHHPNAHIHRKVSPRTRLAD